MRRELHGAFSTIRLQWWYEWRETPDTARRLSPHEAAWCLRWDLYEGNRRSLLREIAHEAVPGGLLFRFNDRAILSLVERMIESGRLVATEVPRPVYAGSGPSRALEGQPQPAPAAAAEPAPPISAALKREPPQPAKTWIAVQLLDEEGRPIPGARVQILPPGADIPMEHPLDEQGCWRFENVDPGVCRVRFPDLDPYWTFERAFVPQ